MIARQIEARGVVDTNVLGAMRKVERHRFIPPGGQPAAYRDTPMPIGYEQTISQPFIVAYMTEALQPQAKDRVLEIGTGWGGFALHAAARYGCKVTTTTISQEQYDLATERVAEARLSDQVTILLQDYRDLTGEYDKIVSIEMIEAVGAQYVPTFFQRLRQEYASSLRQVLRTTFNLVGGDPARGKEIFFGNR